jgi:hypothetical protein
MSPREYGEEFVHFVVGHLLHVCGRFGFVGDARLAEGLHALVGDSQALAAVAFRVFDADGDGAVTPADLATVLSLAKPFFAVTHVALEAKFAAALAQAGAGVRAGGVREDAFAKTMEGVPMLKAWTLVATRRAAEWLARRATARAATSAEQATSPPPPPPRLLPPPQRASRREELERAGRGDASTKSEAFTNATTAASTSSSRERGEESIEKKQRTLTEAEEKSSRRGAEIEDDSQTKTQRHKPSLRPYAYAAAVSVRGGGGFGSNAFRETKTSSPEMRAAAEDAFDSLRASSEVAADGIRDLAVYDDTHVADICPQNFEDMSALAVQERSLEAKMRAEVLAKQRTKLSGVANAKEWNYTAYQHRSRRIEPALGATRGVDLERATRDRVALAEKKKKMENNARRW